MRRKNKKYHLYLEGAKRTQKGYHKTACGRDGFLVGGLIRYFRTVQKKIGV